jgi:hypothetical protein
MKYKLLKSENLPRPGGEKKIIYIIPLTSSPRNYAVIYPEVPPSQFFDSPGTEMIELRRFRGCPDDAVKKVKLALSGLYYSELKKTSSKLSTLWFSGILFIGFGLFDLFLQDPLILLDEVLIFTGGIWMLAGGLKVKKIHRVLKEKQGTIEEKITRIPVSEDTLCSRIFASIQAKDEHFIKEFKEDFAIEGMKDRVELESRWYVDYIKIDELVKTGQIQTADIRNVMKGINCIIPLKKIVELEEMIHKRVIKGRQTATLSRRLKKIKDRISLACGFSEDALTVYSEFYKSCLAYFSSIGETL